MQYSFREKKKKTQLKPLSLHPLIVKWYYTVLAYHRIILTSTRCVCYLIIISIKLVGWAGRISLFFILPNGTTSHFHYLFSCHPLVQWVILRLRKCLLPTGLCSYHLNCPIISLNNVIQVVLSHLTLRWGN